MSAPLRVASLEPRRLGRRRARVNARGGGRSARTPKAGLLTERTVYDQPIVRFRRNKGVRGAGLSGPRGLKLVSPLDTRAVPSAPDLVPGGTSAAAGPLTGSI